MPTYPVQSVRYGDWDVFLTGLKTIKVGESFLFPRINSNHRIIMSAMPRLMDRRYVTARVRTGEGEMWRVGRVR